MGTKGMHWTTVEEPRKSRVFACVTFALRYKLDKYMKERGLTMSTAVVELLEKGLESEKDCRTASISE